MRLRKAWTLIGVQAYRHTETTVCVLSGQQGFLMNYWCRSAMAHCWYTCCKWHTEWSRLSNLGPPWYTHTHARACTHHYNAIPDYSHHVWKTHCQFFESTVKKCLMLQTCIWKCLYYFLLMYNSSKNITG